MRIDDDLLEEMFDDEDSYGTFEHIRKGNGRGRIDSKKLTDKSDRKESQRRRKERKEGKWMIYDIVYGEG